MKNKKKIPAKKETTSNINIEFDTIQPEIKDWIEIGLKDSEARLKIERIKRDIALKKNAEKKIKLYGYRQYIKTLLQELNTLYKEKAYRFLQTRAEELCVIAELAHEEQFKLKIAPIDEIRENPPKNQPKNPN